MKPNNNQIAFLKDNKEKLLEFFRSRVEDLKNLMVAEEKPEERNKIIEAIRENNRWILSIEEYTSEKKGRKIDTGI